MNEALLNDYLLKYGKQIPKDILDIPDLDDRLHAIEKFIQENLEIKLVSREELVKSYLENKKPKEVSEESFAKQRLEFIKRLLKFKTQSPVLELPDSVDKLIALGLTENQAYDLMIEVFSQELGIERAILPKYYEAIRTIDKFVKEGKIDIKLSSEILSILKTRAMPALVAAIRTNANIEEQLITANAAAAASASSDLVYQKVEQLIERCTPYIRDQEQSVQEMFTRHSPNSNSNAIFNSILNYGKDKVVGKVRDFAVKKFLATEFGKKIATQFATKVAPEAIAALGGAIPSGGTSLLLFLFPMVKELGQKVLSWTKINFKKVVVGTVIVLGFVGGGITGAVSSGVLSYVVLNASSVLGTVATGASFLFNIFPEMIATEIVWPIVAIIIATPIVIALILFIITNSALVVPYNDASFNTWYASGSGNSHCGDSPTKIPLPPEANAAVIKAIEIVNGLNQGFWCYWNRSSLFPEYFNEEEFKIGQNHCVYSPNTPPGCVGDFEKLYSDKALFWCTLLIIKSYQAGGFAIKPDAFGTENMRNYFVSESRYEPNAPGVLGRLSPGDAIFLSTGTPGISGHVAMVISTNGGIVTTIDSNADSQIHHYMVRDDGTIGGIPGLEVVGFGKLK